jgi:hypothetical protein
MSRLRFQTNGRWDHRASSATGLLAQGQAMITGSKWTLQRSRIWDHLDLRYLRQIYEAIKKLANRGIGRDEAKNQGGA